MVYTILAGKARQEKRRLTLMDENESMAELWDHIYDDDWIEEMGAYFAEEAKKADDKLRGSGERASDGVDE